MGFAININDTYDNNLIEPGEYEFIIKNAYENATKGGTIYISIDAVIRNDVDQKYKNKHIWHSIWKRREPDKNCIDGYSIKDINTISRAVGFDNGRKFSNLEEWLDSLKGCIFRASVYHDEYNGNVNARLRYIAASKRPNISRPDDIVEDQFTKVDEYEDLPFDI